MNPVTKAMAAGVTRWLMTIAGTYGVDLPFDDLEPLVNGVLIIAPLVWSALHKQKVDKTIKEAQANA